MAKIEDGDEATARIEAALYASGRPLMIEEIVRASGTESRAKTAELLRQLIKKTSSAFKALEVVQLPDGSYVFQLKPEYGHMVRRYAEKPVLPKAMVKTLSYIAYMEPVSSKKLVETRGTGVYAHLKELKRMEYISYQSAGRLKIYTTTERFRKYFGIQGDQDAVKEMLFKKAHRAASL